MPSYTKKHRMQACGNRFEKRFVSLDWIAINHPRRTARPRQKGIEA